VNGKDWHKQLSLGLVCLILGFGISLQLKSVTINDGANNTDMRRAADIQKLLDAEKSKSGELSNQLLQQKNDLDALRQQASKSGDFSAALSDQLKRAEILAGLVEVEGPGISVTLTDSMLNTGNVPASGAENFVIHDTDVRSVINELLSSGAEAIALNDERVVSTSSIRCVGPTVIVNNTRKSTPFEIKAIGEPSTLEAGLNIKSGIVDVLKQWGIGVDIKRSDKVKIPAYKGIISFKYASTVDNLKGSGGQ